MEETGREPPHGHHVAAVLARDYGTDSGHHGQLRGHRHGGCSGRGGHGGGVGERGVHLAHQRHPGRRRRGLLGSDLPRGRGRGRQPGSAGAAAERARRLRLRLGRSGGVPAAGRADSPVAGGKAGRVPRRRGLPAVLHCRPAVCLGGHCVLRGAAVHGQQQGPAHPQYHGQPAQHCAQLLLHLPHPPGGYSGLDGYHPRRRAGGRGGGHRLCHRPHSLGSGHGVGGAAPGGTVPGESPGGPAA